LGGNISSAADINNAGQVAGTSTTAEGDPHAFITGPDGYGMTDIGVLYEGPFMTWSYAYGLNDAGQVVGSSPTMQFEDYSPAFVTGPNGAPMTEFGNFGSVWRHPIDINATEQIVGYFYTPAQARHGFIAGSHTSELTDLGTLGGNMSIPTHINDSGRVIGESTTEAGDHHAFITGPNGVGMIDLGTLGGNYSEALGINDAGQVVGNSLTATGEMHAFVTGPNGVDMMDLNSLISLPTGVILIDARGINNHGQVVALDSASVVPEPQTYALVLAGLGLVSFMARRKTA
jgi:probable HAF family extracellular repeat protein